jgi:hypothetical protein
MSRMEKERLERVNKWREQFPRLDPLAPYERNVFNQQLNYGHGSPEHLEACAVLEMVLEERAIAAIKTERFPRRFVRWVRSALRKYGATTDGS